MIKIIYLKGDDGAVKVKRVQHKHMSDMSVEELIKASFGFGRC